MRAAIVCAILVGMTGAVAPSPGPETIALEGFYRLVKRVLPNGKVVKPPHVLGFMTCTKTERSLAVMWKDTRGAPVSLSVIATYTLKDGRYCETPLYWMQNNMGLPGLSYTPPPEKKRCAEVMTDATGISFEMPGEPERMLFTRDGFIATAKDMWTDTWERVK